MNNATLSQSEIMTSPVALKPHPRLYATSAKLARLGLESPSDIPFLKAAAEQVGKLADEFVQSMDLKFDPNLHNSLLVRAREMQTRVVTLLVRWLQTDDSRYRAAAMEHIREMGRWKHWCWDAMLEAPRSINSLYDLSSGENGTTLAIAYDWMEQTLSTEERAVFAKQALERCFQPFVTVLSDHPGPGRPGWWFKCTLSNWNTVCAGGAGMLALAMREEFPKLAGQVLDLADASIRPYFEGLGATGGGWTEGIGYWNYGHRYGFMYLLSHEQATGQPHPCMALPGVRETLSFPLDFTPHGACCSFSDVNAWHPLPFHYEAALRLNCADVAQALDGRMARGSLAEFGWPDAAEWLVFHGRTAVADGSPVQTNVAKLYPGMDWAFLADQMPKPRLYMAIRGGRTKDPHAMIDVLSFHVVVGEEKLIDHLGNSEADDYMETTFSTRRNDIFENGQQAKNVLFINGVGLPADADVRASTTAVQSGSTNGFRLDATEAFGCLGPDSPMAEFCGRLFLMIHGGAFLIVDRFELPRTGRVETRMHTFATPEEFSHKNGFLLCGRREKLRVTHACDVDAVTATAVACPTKPVRGAAVLRWCTKTRTHRQVTMATLLTPGAGPAGLTLSQADSRLHIAAEAEDWQARLSMSAHLDGLIEG